MKVKLLIAIIALVAFAAGASAQDLGAPDSLIVEFVDFPDVAAGDSVLALNVTFVVDNDISNASSGMSWDFDGFLMDSVVWSVPAEIAFNMMRLPWANNVLDSTNSKKQFQCTGLTFDANFWTTTGVVGTYWGHVTSWVEGDVINISPHSFVAAGFVPAVGDEFPPVWGGDATIADVNAIGGGVLPARFNLAQNYPNPFNPVTRINFDLPKKAHTTLTIFNVLGQRVATLVDKDLAPDFYEIEWKGTTDAGTQVASGIYFYRLSAGENVKTKKMMLLK